MSSFVDCAIRSRLLSYRPRGALARGNSCRPCTLYANDRILPDGAMRTLGWEESHAEAGQCSPQSNLDLSASRVRDGVALEYRASL